MTTPTHSARTPRASNVGPTQSIPTFYRMLLRGQLTRGRFAGLLVLAGLSVLLAVVSRGTSAGDDEATVAVLGAYSIGLLIPLATLLLATPMLGNLIEDRLLVYLWLKPVPRWHLAIASYAAVVTVLVPIVVIAVAASAAAAGHASLVVPAIVASLLGVLAYSAIYLFLGARFTWGLWLGLLYLLLWENVLSRQSDGMAKLSIRSYLLTSLQRGTDSLVQHAGRASWAAIAIPLLVAVAGVALTAWTLQRNDVD